MLVVRALGVLVACSFPAFGQMELQVLRSDDGIPGDQFGFALDADHEHILVGAPNHNEGRGAVYAFRRDDRGTESLKDDVWGQSCKLEAGDRDPGDFFGGAVAFDGTLGVFSASKDDEAGTDAGAVYVFYHEMGGTPGDPIDDGGFELQKLIGTRTVADQRFGRSLAISDSTIVAGTRNGNLAYVFERIDRGTPDWRDDHWIETAVLEGSAAPYPPGRFGWAVATDGDTILVGAPWTDLNLSSNDNSGTVFVFDRDDRGTPGDKLDDQWNETYRFTAAMPVEGGQFGRSVSLQDDLALVGAWRTPVGGRAFAFQRDRNGTPDDPSDDSWNPLDELLSIDGAPDDGFGNEVLLNGDLALVGGEGNDLPDYQNAGAAYAYARSGDTWFPFGKLNGSEVANFDHAGRLASWGQYAFIGAPNGPTSRYQKGAVYVFLLGDCAITCLDFETEDDFETPLLNGQDVSSDEEFGRLVGIDGLSSAGLEAAIFDSSPLGPNSTSTDPDLLVGLGNVLILQELSSQSTPGIYDFPDDDALGGVLTIDFLGREVSVVSLDLIDVDPMPLQEARVTLFDSSGRSRTYTAPSGWTEDVAAIGPPGYRTLSVMTMSDQPGFLSVVSNAQDLTFDPTSVVRMRIVLEGSAAIDNLKFTPKTGGFSTEVQAPRTPGRRGKGGGKKGRR